MASLLKRLAASGAAYQASSLVAGFLALFTLPLYTRHLTSAQLGYAETLLTAIILVSILLRFGIGEAFVRFWFDDADAQRRARLARTTTSFVLVTSTAAGLVAVVLAGPLSRLLLGIHDATLVAAGVLGLWAFTNLEIAYALLRVEERRRTYLIASVSNVLLTVGLTVTLVVGFDGGARGYVLGNYAASTIVLFGLWIFALRGHVAIAPRLRERGQVSLKPMLVFGSPTVPADAAVFALNVIDRAYILRADSPAAAGLYAVAVKLATAVIVAVRGFQLAWPPLAYSLTDEAEAGRVYAFVTTAYVITTGLVVAGFVLLGRWVVRLLAAPSFYAAHEALPWVALGWALYGLFLVFVTIAGRAKVTTRTFPAAARGPRRERGRPRRPRRPAGHRGRRDRPVRRLRRDARRRAPAHAAAVRGAVRVGAPGQDRPDHRRDIDGRGTGPADRRGRRLRRSDRGPGRDPDLPGVGAHLHGATTRQVLGIAAFVMNMPPVRAAAAAAGSPASSTASTTPARPAASPTPTSTRPRAGTSPSPRRTPATSARRSPTPTATSRSPRQA